MFVASFALAIGSVSFAAPQFFSQVAHADSTSFVSSLQPSWDATGGGGVFSAYIGPADGYDYVSPGKTVQYNGREAGIIHAGLATDDEGLFGFKPTGTIDYFATKPSSYDVVNQSGVNPVWMTIEIANPDRSDKKNYQFIPVSNDNNWHTVNAAAGQWQAMDDSGNGTGPMMTLGEVATANSGKYVTRAYLRLGMGDSYKSGTTGTVAWVDKATIGGVAYDFVIAPPSVTITSPALNQPINGHTVTIKGTATDTDFNYYYCYIEDSHGEVGARDASCTTTWHAVDTTGTLGTVTLPSGTPDGNYVAHLVAYDKDHNVAEVTQAFVLDNTAPATPAISYPTDNSFVANIQKVTWSAVTDNLANPVTYIYQSSTNSGTNVDGSFASPAYTSSNLSDTQIPTLDTPEGTYYLHVKAVDAAGNMSTWSTTVKVTVDNTAPVAIISAPTTGGVSGHTLNIEGAATDANFNYYYCYVTNANGEVGIRDPQCVTAWSAGSPFHSAFAATVTGTAAGHLGSVDLTGLSSGIYQVHLVTYDKAGNSTEATPVFFTLDNSAPVALINAVATDTTQPTITGTLDDVDAVFTVKLDGKALDVKRKDTGWSAFVTTPLSYGTHTLVAMGTDLAGNSFETTQDFTTVTPAALAPVLTQPVATVNTPAPLAQNLAAFAATPAATDDTAVLGASTTKDTPAVAGAQTSKKVAADAMNNDGNGFTASWYWLLTIPAAIGAGWWATAAYRRRDV